MSTKRDQIFEELFRIDSRNRGSRIAELRVQAGLSMSDFGDQLGFSPAQVRDLERGTPRRRLTSEQLALIAKILAGDEEAPQQPPPSTIPEPAPQESTPQASAKKTLWQRIEENLKAITAVIVALTALVVAIVGLWGETFGGDATTPTPTPTPVPVLPAAEFTSAEVKARRYTYGELLGRYPDVPTPTIDAQRRWPGFLVSTGIRLKGNGKIWHRTWSMVDAATGRIFPTTYVEFGSGSKVSAAPIKEVWAERDPDWDEAVIEVWIPYPPCNRSARVTLKFWNENWVGGNEIRVRDENGNETDLELTIVYEP